MLSLDTRKALARAIYNISEQELSIESQRQILCSETQFNPYQTFKKLTRMKDSITSIDIVLFLKEQGQLIDETNTTNLINFYDQGKSQKLSYSDFMSMILPTDHDELRTSTAQIDIEKDENAGQQIPPNVESSLTILIMEELEIIKLIDASNKDLSQRTDYSVMKCFNEIDKLHKNAIDYDAIEYFLETNGVSCKEANILSFIRRFDIDRDCKLNYKEFLLGFMAASNQSFTASTNAFSPSKSIPQEKGIYTPKTFSPGHSHISKMTPSKATDDKIVSALKHQINLERELELQKENLAMKSDFNLLDAFRIFDVNGKGWVTLAEYKVGYAVFKLIISTEDIMLFFRRYDKDNDGRLKYSDFCEAFTPKQKEYAAMLNNRLPVSFKYNKPLAQYFSEDTNEAISRVLMNHVKCEQASEELRQRLSLNQTFNIYDAFQSCDIKGLGYITKDDFQQFLEENGFIGTQKDYDILMGKFDQNKDGKVSYTEFVNEFTPKSPIKK